MSSSSNKDGLRINGLTISYKEGVPAFGPASLHIPEHGIYTLIGPSGCGKSTLLKAVAGLLPRYTGDITYNGQPANGRDTLIGLVPQTYGLLPWKTVTANLRTALAVTLPGRERKEEREERISRWLEDMAIADLAGRYPLSLSGGQQQRVAVARAFALLPEIMLLDEPFSALDAMTRETLQRLFLENWQKHPVTALFVTHDVEEAILLGERIVVMVPGSRELDIIDNPVFSLNYEDKRSSAEFFEQTKLIRKVMQEKW
ncbi:NitT/TauT family transport system ATP-binding protein [Paenibacillus sophorae]|uniref:ATP-binding cassette domain-containing protein n=1 Tax=Paenibacillus sophorae TaxID=1333845 RepID=A0A1H8QD94_9BACL|nr:ATP-binding cassette domain-containing protein [Paenibacillus sophorae]QWU15176.1 ATP-binding cassette domain-containing protein [Paenibacillus sophorae]SEO51981.1 NitT/TauT family transport system ATP-binding protein [Paenibacillus sophorae]